MSLPHPTSIPYADLQILSLGPPLEHGVTPTVIYFSLTAKDSLVVEPYNQPTVELLKDPNIRVISVTLPLHEGIHPDDALLLWAEELKQGNDIITPFLEEVIAFIEDLKRKECIHEDSLALLGLSRGGWVACQIAARTKVKAVAGFAPLTQFSKSPFFANIEGAEQFDLKKIADKLIGTPIHFWISNRDQRVGTRLSFDFIEQLAILSQEKGIRSPQVFMQIVAPVGALGHGTSKESFIKGAKWASSLILP